MPILYDIMALHKKAALCFKSSQVSLIAFLVNRGSGADVAKVSKSITEGHGWSHCPKPRVQISPPAAAQCVPAPMCIAHCTAGSQGAIPPQRGKSIMQIESNLPLMKSLPVYVFSLIKERMGAAPLKKNEMFFY